MRRTFTMLNSQKDEIYDWLSDNNMLDLLEWIVPDKPMEQPTDGKNPKLLYPRLLKVRPNNNLTAERIDILFDEGLIDGSDWATTENVVCYAPVPSAQYVSKCDVKIYNDKKISENR